MYTVHVGVQSLTNIKEMKIASECIVELYTCKHAEIFKNTRVREVHSARRSARGAAEYFSHFSSAISQSFYNNKKDHGYFCVDSFVDTLNLLNGLVTSTFMYCSLSDHFLGYDVRYCFTQYNNKNILYCT